MLGWCLDVWCLDVWCLDAGVLADWTALLPQPNTSVLVENSKPTLRLLHDKHCRSDSSADWSGRFAAAQESWRQDSRHREAGHGPDGQSDQEKADAESEENDSRR